ncbi:hypothetical protein HYT23_04865 [Candidatus Pacearchaeota archaeon]|nr:hypothetical protein [Candidatus Pacearchaeota archaeon]
MVQIKAVHEIIREISPHYAKTGEPESEHRLVYESNSEGLEPVYFFIIDLIEGFGLSPEKLVDNFSSSPGSGYFAEMGQRASIMQQQGAKILGDVNAVLRSVLNLIYDLKEFRIRLQSYDDLKKPSTKDAAVLSLKQIWMDKVDINKGNSSIKAMALSQAGFQTLIDAFLVVKDAKEVDKLDLNDRVKRILVPRVAEFNAWLEQSEKELRKRYELEKTYLKSQVSSLKLYSRWAKPYLRAASQLEAKDFGTNPALVKVFNTLLLELSLLGKQELKVKEAALEGELPNDFTKDSFLKSLKRKYYGCLLIDFKFRGIPQKIQGSQHYTFGGKSEVVFRSYALNDDEINKLKQELDKSDLSDALLLVEGTTDESLSHLQEEIDFFLEDKDVYEESKSSDDSSNPFLALFGFYDKAPNQKKQKPDKKKEIIVKADNWVEKNNLRPLAAERIKEISFSVFDIYKKAHGMASFT